MARHLNAVLLLVLLGLLPTRLQAASFQLTPSKDTTIFDAAQPTSNAKGQFSFVGKNSSGIARRGLLAFDLGEVELGEVTITGASLELNMSRTNSADQEVSLHRLTQNWGEGLSAASGGEGTGAMSTAGDATWQDSFLAGDGQPQQAWMQAGGDFESEASAVQLVGGIGKYEWDSPAMVADIEFWLANPASNFGWIMIGDESVLSLTKRFDTRENVIPENHPVLTVTYEPQLLGDFNSNGRLDVDDLNQLSESIRSLSLEARFDLNGDGNLDEEDRETWIVDLKNTFYGDSDLDGEFASSDLIAVFQAAEYEDGIPGNSTWSEGDWNGDSEFDTVDFVFAFRAGGYESGPRIATSVPEPTSTCWILVLGLLPLRGRHAMWAIRVKGIVLK